MKARPGKSLSPERRLHSVLPVHFGRPRSVSLDARPSDNGAIYVVVLPIESANGCGCVCCVCVLGSTS
jgi:hypothetical protein